MTTVRKRQERDLIAYLEREIEKVRWRTNSPGCPKEYHELLANLERRLRLAIEEQNERADG